MGLPPILQQEEDMAQEDGCALTAFGHPHPPNSLSPDCDEKHAFVTVFFSGGGGSSGGGGESEKIVLSNI